MDFHSSGARPHLPSFANKTRRVVQSSLHAKLAIPQNSDDSKSPVSPRNAYGLNSNSKPSNEHNDPPFFLTKPSSNPLAKILEGHDYRKYLNGSSSQSNNLKGFSIHDSSFENKGVTKRPSVNIPQTLANFHKKAFVREGLIHSIQNMTAISKRNEKSPQKQEKSEISICSNKDDNSGDAKMNTIDSTAGQFKKDVSMLRGLQKPPSERRIKPGIQLGRRIIADKQGISFEISPKLDDIKIQGSMKAIFIGNKEPKHSADSLQIDNEKSQDRSLSRNMTEKRGLKQTSKIAARRIEPPSLLLVPEIQPRSVLEKIKARRRVVDPLSVKNVEKHESFKKFVAHQEYRIGPSNKSHMQKTHNFDEEAANVRNDVFGDLHLKEKVNPSSLGEKKKSMAYKQALKRISIQVTPVEN